MACELFEDKVTTESASLRSNALLQRIFRESLRATLARGSGAASTLVKDLKRGISLDVDLLVTKFKSRWFSEGRYSHPIDYSLFTGSCVLLMYKNLQVTNLWPTELISLLRIFSLEENAKRKFDHAYVSFSSDEDYTVYLTELFYSLTRSLFGAKLILKSSARRNPINELTKSIVRDYGDILCSTLTINFLNCSSILNIPISRRIDLRQIIAQSGYIHSGGPSIYTSPVSEATIEGLHDGLSCFLKRCPNKPIFVTPYAEEFFSPYDQYSPVSLRNGLNGVKIQLKKLHIGGTPLRTILANLKDMNGLENQLFVPLGLKDFAKERNDASNTDRDGSIWFIVDKGNEISINSGKFFPNEQKQHLLVYYQAFLNDNQFILFKERKPGWYASITQPHSMAGAIVNVVRGTPFSKTHGTARPHIILDPFCGTGTSLIEAALRFENAIIIGLDNDERALRAIKDNFDFFSLEAGQIEKYVGLVKGGIDFLKVPDPRDATRSLSKSASDVLSECNRKQGETFDRNDPGTAGFRYVIRLVNQILIEGVGEHSDHEGRSPSQRSKNDETLSKRILTLVDTGFGELVNRELFAEKTGLMTRFIFYVLWRAVVLGDFSLRNNFENLPLVFLGELERVLRELTHHQRTLEGKTSLEKTNASLKGRGSANFAENLGLYSRTLFVNPSAIKSFAKRIQEKSFEQFKSEIVGHWKPGIWLVRVPDSLDALKYLKNSVDVIITDPPYGFNTHSSSSGDNLFGTLPPLLIDALTERGQLAMVLPSFAKNGRDIPFHQTSRNIVRQIINHAKRTRKPLMDDVKTLPRPYELFARPYYWVSTTVLERSILHFRASQL